MLTDNVRTLLIQALVSFLSFYFLFTWHFTGFSFNLARTINLWHAIFFLNEKCLMSTALSL